MANNSENEPSPKPASQGLWSALERFFGKAPAGSKQPDPEPKYSNEEMPSTKRKRSTRQPRKRKKTPEERREDREEVRRVIHDVLEDSQLTNARAMTAALEGSSGIAPELDDPAPSSPTDRGGTSSPDPMAPLPGMKPRQPYSPRPRGPGGRFLPRGADPDTPPKADPQQPAPAPADPSDRAKVGPWGGRGTHRVPKPKVWNLPQGPHFIHPQGVDGLLPPQAEQEAPPSVDTSRGGRGGAQAQNWVQKLVGSFQNLHRAMQGGGGGAAGGGGSGGMRGMSRMMQMFARMGTQGAGTLLAGGAGAGGAGAINLAGAGAARAGMAGLGAMGTAGALTGGVLAVVGAFILLRRVATQLVEAQSESLRQFAQFNSGIANAFIKADFASKKRDFAQGAMNSQSSQRLVEAVSAMKDEALPMKAAVTELLNITATYVVGILRNINSAMMMMPGFKDYLEELVEQGKQKGNAQRSALTNFMRDVGQGVFNRKPGEGGN